MSGVAAIGAEPDVAGFALAGAYVIAAETAEAITAAWQALPETVAVVILTPAAASVIGDERYAAKALLTVVLPP